MKAGGLLGLCWNVRPNGASHDYEYKRSMFNPRTRQTDRQTDRQTAVCPGSDYCGPDPEMT